ncbi:MULTISPECIES: two-component system sensor histidine kinase NtrB [Caulobacter]|jgi:two-component system nitrogen regulation sensor histidine kinase GlnL|uniref:histidine kinase n=1 Tax=Caulobacter radicis TaxID=2172650 RepID=A0A2T9JNP5_9CAUL|nr:MULTISPECIES: nitrogen regulation protein NR(II) [Caulobacter]MDG2527149.1 nitrogen regulation protein NR(II) [Caulobacter endophyticus]PVM85335.1 ATPase [Caulobacter radicis]
MTDRARVLSGPALDALKAAAFELSPEPALVVDREGGLVAVNEAAEALFGHGLSLLARGRFRAALPPGSVLVSLMDRAVFEGALVREHGVEVNLFGQPPFEADGAAVPLGDGSVLLTLHVKGALGVERAADQAGLRSVVGLGRMLAHEIKNPLAGIRGAAQLLKTGASAADQPLAQLIVDETDRIRRLVDRMEAFSDQAPTPREAVNIHQVLDRVRALVANGVADGLRLRDHYDPSLPPVWGDEDQLIQIFLNLVKNASEAAHMRGDGQGELTIHTAWRPGVRVRGADGKSASSAPIEIRVQDNGPGVPQSLREHLFQPFVTTKANGTGLGLALVTKLVTAHGGLIDFESEPGRTVFRVLLPVAPEPSLGDA